MSENGRDGFFKNRVSGKVTVEQLLSFAFGVVFVSILLILAVAIPEGDQPEFIFRIVMALAAAGVGAMIPGLLDVEMKASNQLQIRAAGALALFVIVFLLNPPRWVTRGENEAQPAGDQGAVPMAQSPEWRGVLRSGLAQVDEAAKPSPASIAVAQIGQKSTVSRLRRQARVADNLAVEQTPSKQRAGEWIW